MYERFADIYDRLQNINYDDIVGFYIKAFERCGLKPELILDLGCGTGNVTIPLAKAGYDMIGADISEEMLSIAAEKAKAENLDILFLNQDMTEFELYGTVDVITCALDGVNYLTQDGDIEKLFALVKNYLNPNGLFIFDVNTEYKMKNVLDNNVFIYDEGDVYCIWSSEYDEKSRVCGFYLDFFIETENGLYEKCCEYQEERAYTTDEILAIAEKYGFTVAGMFDGIGFSKATPESEKISFILQKK